MPDLGHILIQFLGDVAPLTSACNKAESEIAAVGSHKPTSEFGALMAKDVGKGKEALEKLGEASEKTRDKVKDFGKEIAGVGLQFAGIVGGVEIFKHAIEAASGLQTAALHLNNALGGNAAQTHEMIEGLEGVSSKTNYSTTALTKYATELVAAGTAPDKVGDNLQALGGIARATGSDLGEIVDIYDRIQLKGEVSGKELVKIAIATGGATRDLGKEYTRLKPELEATIKLFDQQYQLEQKAFEQRIKSITLINTFNEKIGLTEVVYKRWLTDMRQSTFATAPGFGGNQIGTESAGEISQFREGIGQIGREQGISRASVEQLARQGIIGFKDLIEAAGRAQEAIQHVREEAAKQFTLKLTTDEQSRSREILGEISAKMTDLGASEKRLGDYQDTWQGKMDKTINEIDKLFEAIGKPLVEHFDQVAVAVGLVGAAFVAIQIGETIRGLATMSGWLVRLAAEWLGVGAAATTTAVAEGTASAIGTGGPLVSTGVSYAATAAFHEKFAMDEGERAMNAAHLSSLAVPAETAVATTETAALVTTGTGLTGALGALLPPLGVTLAAALALKLALETANKSPGLNEQATDTQKKTDLDAEESAKRQAIEVKYSDTMDDAKNAQKLKELSALHDEYDVKRSKAPEISDREVKYWDAELKDQKDREAVLKRLGVTELEIQTGIKQAQLDKLGEQETKPWAAELKDKVLQQGQDYEDQRVAEYNQQKANEELANSNKTLKVASDKASEGLLKLAESTKASLTALAKDSKADYEKTFSHTDHGIPEVTGEEAPKGVIEGPKHRAAREARNAQAQAERAYKVREAERQEKRKEIEQQAAAEAAKLQKDIIPAAPEPIPQRPIEVYEGPLTKGQARDITNKPTGINKPEITPTTPTSSRESEQSTIEKLASIARNTDLLKDLLKVFVTA